MKKFILYIIVCITWYTQARAQSSIRGTVLSSATHQPLAGASIAVKNTLAGTNTDEQGQFRIDGVPPRAVLQISHIGYKTLELSLNAFDQMGHVAHHHAIKGLARQYGIDQLLKSMTGGFSDLGTVGQGGGLLLALRNGRAFERDADATGVELLEKLGLRADGIASFFQRMLEERPGDVAAMIGIWSSHPPTAERIAATRRPAAGKPAFSDAEWQSLRAICNVSGSAPRQ